MRKGPGLTIPTGNASSPEMAYTSYDAELEESLEYQRDIETRDSPPTMMESDDWYQKQLPVLPQSRHVFGENLGSEQTTHD
jgi:hypothetical protein